MTHHAIVRRTKAKGQTMIYKKLHRTHNTYQYEPHYHPWWIYVHCKG